MLTDGTRRQTQRQIADFIEYYGASLQAEAFGDYAALTLLALPRYVPELVPLMRELITEATFPQRELAIFTHNRKQRLQVELQRVEFLAQRAFQHQLYGEQHPYGYASDAADYDALTPELLQQFRQQCYGCGPFFIIASGAVDPSITTLLEDHLGDLAGAQPQETPAAAADNAGSFRIPKEGALQAALRVGKRMVNRKHPDYNRLVVVNTILGGYFGSRLMQNLREAHGYCYGVHSSLISFRHDAHLCISTEVGQAVAPAALDEIYKEIQRLRQEPVSDDELQLVKNYLMGALLADTDGALNTADIYRGLILHGQQEADFAARIEAIRQVTAEEVQELAVKHLDPEQMVEVAAGM